MSLVPEKTVERIQFWENHTGPFSTNAVAIGITTTEATDLTTKTGVKDGFHRPQAKGGLRWIDRDRDYVYTENGAGSMTQPSGPRSRPSSWISEQVWI